MYVYLQFIVVPIQSNMIKCFWKIWIEKFKELKFNPFSSNMIILPDFPPSFRNVLQKNYPRGDYRFKEGALTSSI